MTTLRFAIHAAPALLAGAILASISTLAQAQQNAGTAANVDEEQIVQRVREEILKELREGDFLREQIERGIEDYVRKQQQAREAERAQREQAVAAMARNVRRISSERDHVYGDPSATISLIEYSDFECPFCKRFHPTAKKIVDDYAGKVNWVYRHFPLGFHNPGAQKQAEASECAAEQGGNAAFWRYADEIYARTKSNGQGFALADLVPLAEKHGLDGAAFDECLRSGRYAARVNEDFEEGRRIGINGTPGNILVNNESGEVRVISGAVPHAALKAEIDRLLD